MFGCCHINGKKCTGPRARARARVRVRVRARARVRVRAIPCQSPQYAWQQERGPCLHHTLSLGLPLRVRARVRVRVRVRVEIFFLNT